MFGGCGRSGMGVGGANKNENCGELRVPDLLSFNQIQTTLLSICECVRACVSGVGGFFAYPCHTGRVNPENPPVTPPPSLSISLL